MDCTIDKMISSKINYILSLITFFIKITLLIDSLENLNKYIHIFSSNQSFALGFCQFGENFSKKQPYK